MLPPPTEEPARGGRVGHRGGLVEGVGRLVPLGSFPSPFLLCEFAASVLPSFSPQGVRRCDIDVPPPDRVGAFCPVCLCVRVCVCVCVLTPGIDFLWAG